MSTDDEVAATLAAAIRREGRIYLWLAVPFLVFGAGMVALAPVVHDWFPFGAGLTLAVLGGLFLRPAVRDPRRHRVLRALASGELENVELVYTSYGGGGSPQPVLHFALTRRRTCRVTVPLGTEKPLLAALGRRLRGD